MAGLAGVQKVLPGYENGHNFVADWVALCYLPSPMMASGYRVGSGLIPWTEASKLYVGLWVSALMIVATLVYGIYTVSTGTGDCNGLL